MFAGTSIQARYISCASGLVTRCTKWVISVESSESGNGVLPSTAQKQAMEKVSLVPIATNRRIMGCYRLVISFPNPHHSNSQRMRRKQPAGYSHFNTRTNRCSIEVSPLPNWHDDPIVHPDIVEPSDPWRPSVYYSWSWNLSRVNQQKLFAIVTHSKSSVCSPYTLVNFSY